MPLRSRIALVTGATQGIGLAIAEQLAERGASLVLHDRLPDDEGRSFAGKFARRTDVAASYLSADLRDQAATASLVRRAVEAGMPPDILVNNAGIQFTSPVDQFPIDRWNDTVAVNLTAAFLLMRAAVPLMRQRGWGRIVNIASVHGLVASVNKAAYLASKHGLVGVSKGVALETATDGITVNCVCPGWTDTPILGPQIAQRAHELGVNEADAIKDLMREKQPNLTLLPPKRIGEVVAFLCSDAAQGITGASLPVDGGWTAQ